MDSKVRDFITKMAADDFEVGQILSEDDYSLFARLCSEEGVDVNRQAFDFYFECINNEFGY